MNEARHRRDALPRLNCVVPAVYLGQPSAEEAWLSGQPRAARGAQQKCQAFAKARPPGSNWLPKRHALRDAGSRPGVQTQPNQGCPPRGTRKPTFTSNRAWSRGARTRGTNRLAAPNGRDCLTSVTSQNWRGARPLPPPAPLGPAHPPLRSQSEGEELKSARGGGAGWRPGEAGARSGLAWAELQRAGVLRGAE